MAYTQHVTMAPASPLAHPFVWPADPTVAVDDTVALDRLVRWSKVAQTTFYARPVPAFVGMSAPLEWPALRVTTIPDEGPSALLTLAFRCGQSAGSRMVRAALRDPLLRAWQASPGDVRNLLTHAALDANIPLPRAPVPGNLTRRQRVARRVVEDLAPLPDVPPEHPRAGKTRHLNEVRAAARAYLADLLRTTAVEFSSSVDGGERAAADVLTELELSLRTTPVQEG